jgi:putative FmdB family regulatory protein
VPLYEYYCQDCGHVVEVLQRLGERGAGLPCPACGADRLERALSTFASAVVRGTGPASCPPGTFT